jgi:hypothetical protein
VRTAIYEVEFTLLSFELVSRPDVVGKEGFEVDIGLQETALCASYRELRVATYTAPIAANAMTSNLIQSVWIMTTETDTKTNIVPMAIALVRGEMAFRSSQSRRVCPKTGWFSSQDSNRGEERLNAQSAAMKKMVDGKPGTITPT